MNLATSARVLSLPYSAYLTPKPVLWAVPLRGFDSHPGSVRLVFIVDFAFFLDKGRACRGVLQREVGALYFCSVLPWLCGIAGGSNIVPRVSGITRV